MDYVVRAVDVGFGNTKFVSNVAGSDIRCACFPSVAYPTMREPSGQPGYERRKTVAIPINGLFYEVGGFNIRSCHVVSIEPTGFDGISDGMKDFMDRYNPRNTSVWRFNE